MKTALFTLFTFLLLLSGCSNDNKNEPITQAQNKKSISSIIQDRTGNELVSYRKVILTQELFKTAISDLKEIADSISPDASKDKEQVNAWIKTLNDTEIDFDKENILLYTFEQPHLCDYKESSVLKDTNLIEITFMQTSEICADSNTIYFLAYKVSKDIEKIKIKPFASEAVTIQMR